MKIDHNINEAHRISGTYSYETNDGEDGEALWPEHSYGGIVLRKPQTFTATLTSTLRPTLLNEFRVGVSRTATATYTWSRNLGRTGDITDYRDWSADYRLQGSHRSHQLNVNGNYTLPFGASGFILRDVHGALRKTVEGWSLGWILSLTSGPPMSISGMNSLWANGSMNLVRPDLWDNKGGKAEWSWEDNDGYYCRNGKK